MIARTRENKILIALRASYYVALLSGTTRNGETKIEFVNKLEFDDNSSNSKLSTVSCTAFAHDPIVKDYENIVIVGFSKGSVLTKDFIQSRSINRFNHSMKEKDVWRKAQV